MQRRLRTSHEVCQQLRHSSYHCRLSGGELRADYQAGNPTTQKFGLCGQRVGVSVWAFASPTRLGSSYPACPHPARVAFLNSAKPACLPANHLLRTPANYCQSYLPHAGAPLAAPGQLHIDIDNSGRGSATQHLSLRPLQCTSCYCTARSRRVAMIKF
jgi:hypothetical protein